VIGTALILLTHKPTLPVQVAALFASIVAAAGSSTLTTVVLLIATTATPLTIAITLGFAWRFAYSSKQLFGEFVSYKGAKKWKFLPRKKFCCALSTANDNKKRKTNLSVRMGVR